MNEFLNMGGYGGYIWASYGLTLAVLVLNLWLARRGLNAALLHARRRASMARDRSDTSVAREQADGAHR